MDDGGNGVEALHPHRIPAISLPEIDGKFIQIRLSIYPNPSVNLSKSVSQFIQIRQSIYPNPAVSLSNMVACLHE